MLCTFSNKHNFTYTARELSFQLSDIFKLKSYTYIRILGTVLQEFSCCNKIKNPLTQLARITSWELSRAQLYTAVLHLRNILLGNRVRRNTHRDCACGAEEIKSIVRFVIVLTFTNKCIHIYIYIFYTYRMYGCCEIK